MQQYFIKESVRGFDTQRPEDILLSRDSPTIIFDNEVNRETASHLIATLRALDTNKEDEPVLLMISSPGGLVLDGLAVYDEIKRMNREVIMYASGLVASIATIIYLAGKKRLITPHSQLLIHNPSIYLQGGQQSALCLDEEAKRILQIRDILADILVENSKASRKQILNMMKTDTYLSATEALEYGFATEIV